jgi:peptide chain release factor subunit 1
MLNEIDLKKLARLSSHDRAFLSLYMSDPDALPVLEKRIATMEKIVKGNPDESKHLEENVKIAREYLEKNPPGSGSLCLFCCWLLDYVEAHSLDVPVETLIRLDSSPYIRPLAELQDEYENFAVVAADNTVARIFLVASGKADSEERIRGNIKNHVRVGGWSQQRYERRRDKQLHQYAREIAERLAELDRNGEFRRIILVGSRETLAEIRKALPDPLERKLVGEKALDLRKGDKVIHGEIFDLFAAEERRSERTLWERIKSRYLSGGLAVVGIEGVLRSARMGRVAKAIVHRDAQSPGIRCRSCEGLFGGQFDRCPDCGSPSVFRIDLINEVVELLAATGADVDFADEIRELREAGHMAALLRY